MPRYFRVGPVIKTDRACQNAGTDQQNKSAFFRAQTFDAVAYLPKSAVSMRRRIHVVMRLKTAHHTARIGCLTETGLLQPTATSVPLTRQIAELNWYARQLARLQFSFVS